MLQQLVLLVSLEVQANGASESIRRVKRAITDRDAQLVRPDMLRPDDLCRDGLLYYRAVGVVICAPQCE